MKKLFALILAALLLLGLCNAAWATDAASYSITINNADPGHTYQAYQIFTGDISGDYPNYVLSNIELGEGVSENFLPISVNGTDYATLEALTEALNTNNVDAFAKAASEKLGTPAASSTFVEGQYTIPLSQPGYYFVKETTANMPDGEAYTKFMVQVVGNVALEPKTATTTHEKKVQENEKYTENATSANAYQYGEGYNDVADYCIGDDVPFSLYSKVPDLTHYDRYLMVFHDKMDPGLTFNADSVEVIVGETHLINGTNYTVNTACDDGCTFEVRIHDLKAYSGQNVRVDFTAELNSSAVIGLDGNLNKSKLSFSNNPNNTGDGTTDGDTTTTPWDEVVVFTYELDVTKVDGTDNTLLKDAKFVLKNDKNQFATVDANGKLTGWVNSQEAATPLVSDENGRFKVSGLDDGTYSLIETKAPENYNKLANPITIVISANTSNGHAYSSTDSENPALTDLKVKVDNTEGTGNTATGIVKASVKNNKGAILPTTGGIGTTIFYVAGGVLVLLAVVLLVTKRRVGEGN